MSKSIHTAYAVLSGILLSLPWYQGLSGFFLFLAFVPLLLMEDDYFTSNSRIPDKQVFLFASLSFFIWNTASTWWIANASVAGALTAIIVNTFLFSLIFWLFHVTRKTLGPAIGYASLIIYWTAFEYSYLNAEISWPWLNLGNGFANDHRFIQWYEFTGTLGGTIWVLAVNIILVNGLKNLIAKKQTSVFWWSLVLICFTIIPTLFSLHRYKNYTEKTNPCSIAVLQPNFNPYAPVPPLHQCNVLINLADSIINHTTDFILAPEGSLEDNIWESALDNNFSLFTLRSFISNHPASTFVTGAFTYKNYSKNDKIPPTAQILAGANRFYESFNSALRIDPGGDITIYHKSKLVVGIEKFPYPNLLSFMKTPLKYFGGSFISYGTQKTRDVFASVNNRSKLAPVICYESVYGEFVAGYIRNGANIIGILTNDGWWGNTPGYLQHFSYAKLRAVETRRSIARASSTGISGFINQRGDIMSVSRWDKQTSLRATLNANDSMTFYVRHGDYTGKISAILSIVILTLTFVITFFRLKKTK